MKLLFSLVLCFYAWFASAQQPADTSAKYQYPGSVPLPGDAVKIFPNPAGNDLYITVRMESLRIRTVFLYDKDGNRVMEYRNNAILAVPVKLNLSQLPKGK
ncbi:MAG TPA: hypothetical protein VF145_12305, partial [Chitinophagaceae bacterium]